MTPQLSGADASSKDASSVYDFNQAENELEAALGNMVDVNYNMVDGDSEEGNLVTAALESSIKKLRAYLLKWGKF